MRQSDNLYLSPQDNLDFIPVVARECGLKTKEIFLRTNKRPIVAARQIAIWLQYHENLRIYNTPKIAKITAKYPGRNNKKMHHSSIIHSFHKVNDLMDVDRHYRTLIYKIQIKIWGSIKYKN